MKRGGQGAGQLAGGRGEKLADRSFVSGRTEDLVVGDGSDLGGRALQRFFVGGLLGGVGEAETHQDRGGGVRGLTLPLRLEEPEERVQRVCLRRRHLEERAMGGDRLAGHGELCDVP